MISSFIRILFIYVLTTIVGFAAIDELMTSFQPGIRAYQNGQYEIAKMKFTSALEANENAAARHNLALTYFQFDMPIEAIWQLERALLLDPLNSEYRYKLDTIRQKLGLFKSSPKWYLLASQVLPTKTWLIIASISFWLLIATLTLTRLGQIKTNIYIKSIRLISLVALILSLPCIWLNLRLLNSGTIISSKITSIHSAPASAAPESGSARPGERAYILDQYNNFYKIETEGLATGWISKDAFRRLVQ